MKYYRLLNLLILSCLLMGCASSIKDQSYLQEYGHQGGRGQGFRTAPYRVAEEAHECVSGEVSGRIRRLRVEAIAPDLEPGLALDIQTPDRGLVHVHVGPLGLLDRQESDLKRGDHVTLKVLCYQLPGGRETLLASQITHDDRTLVLHDAQSRPIWKIGRNHN